ncbi:MAG: signal peptidase I [Patescibacteria group bacterium]|jgi:signal peptidase I
MASIAVIVDFFNRVLYAELVMFSKQTTSFILEVVKIVVISLAIIIPVRYFLIQPFYVIGASMEPNFADYNYLIIDELSYRFNPPQRGEVIVLRNPQKPSEFFIKRLIGLPGETVKINDGKIYINDQLLDETVYLSAQVVTTSFVGYRNIKLGSDEYFVVGDNREHSQDSRRFGPIKQASIIGRVWIRVWPFTQFTIYKK